jgi:hypothetical protein
MQCNIIVQCNIIQYNIIPYIQFPRWRKENNVDAIREDIVHGGKTPLTFPHAADFLLPTGNQVIMSTGMRDVLGNLIAVETYEYSPKAILAGKSIDNYAIYMIYCMEYKMTIVEQISELKERKYLEACNYNPPELQHGYGVILQCTIIRDLAHVSMEFMSAESKALLKVSLDIAQKNYPEMLYKSHLVNSGWVFSTIWYFVKGLLDANTAAKVTTSSTDFVKTLKNEVTADNIPMFMGGKFNSITEPAFAYDLSELGPLHFFACDGSKPSCYLEYQHMKDTAPIVGKIPFSAADAPPAPPAATGPFAVHGILASSAEGGFEHARRPSLGGDGPRVEGVILDLDGTLLDTEALSARAINRVLEPLLVDGVRCI